MYNDYYLQQIDNKIAITNTTLNTIHNDLATISTNQATLNNTLKFYGIMIVAIISFILIYKFTERCLR